VIEGRVVGVWGPTGAPGRTSTAIGIATSLTMSGHRVILVDADTYGGAIAACLELFDEVPGFLSFARLVEAERLDDSDIDRLVHRCLIGKNELAVLTGITNTARWPELSPARVRAAIARLRQDFDFVVVDLGFNLEEDEEIVSDLMSPRRNQTTATLVKLSDCVVAVSNAEVVGLARFIHSLESVKLLAESTPIVSVINRLRRKGALSSAAVTVRTTLHRFAGIDEVSFIDEDVRSFDAATAAGVPLAVAAPRSNARKQLDELAQYVVERTVA